MHCFCLSLAHYLADRRGQPSLVAFMHPDQIKEEEEGDGSEEEQTDPLSTSDYSRPTLTDVDEGGSS